MLTEVNHETYNLAVTTNEDIATIIIEALNIVDVASIGRTSHIMHKITHEVCRRRLKCILAPFTDGRYSLFIKALQISKGVITGSAARSMLTGDNIIVNQDLNIVVPYAGFSPIDTFVVDQLHYECTSRTPHRALSSIIHHYHQYTANHRTITVACSRPTSSLLHIILNSPCTADMVFMTTGGLTCFYPQWMRQAIAIQTRVGHLLSNDGDLGCGKKKASDIRIERDTDFLGSACGNRCPTLWHHISQKHLRTSVDWDVDDSVTQVFHNVDVEWRLNEHCSNSACRYNSQVMCSNVVSCGSVNSECMSTSDKAVLNTLLMLQQVPM